MHYDAASTRPPKTYYIRCSTFVNLGMLDKHSRDSYISRLCHTIIIYRINIMLSSKTVVIHVTVWLCVGCRCRWGEGVWIVGCVGCVGCVGW